MARGNRVARSLGQLLSQINAAHPGRSKASDGFVGDAAHATRDSDHNPWVGPDPEDGLMIITAGDFTHDPGHGFDAYAFAEALKAAKDPRVKYVISNWRIWSLARDGEGWRVYPGDNGHTKHTHVSVSPLNRLYDSVAPWVIGTAKPPEDSMANFTADQLTRIVRDVVQAQDRALYNLAGNGTAAKNHQEIEGLLRAGNAKLDQLVTAVNALTVAVKAKP